MTRLELNETFSVSEPMFDAKWGWPAADDLYYEYLLCHGVLKSRPTNSGSCICGNLFIDLDAGRLGTRKGDTTVILIQVKEREG